MELDFAPKLIGGIGKWELFPGIFVIGNAELDRYIRVPSESVDPVWCAIQHCDGHRSLTEVVNLALAGGRKIDGAELYRKLANAGLVTGSRYVSDVNRASVTWFEARIGRLFPVWRGWVILAHLLTVAIFLSVLGGGVVWLAAPVRVVGTWKATNFEFALAALAGALISILIHEAGHVSAACAEGLKPSRVRLLGYLGLIPYVMLSIPGLYTIRPAGRLRVWIAGPLASLSLASFSYLASGLQTLPVPARVWLVQMRLANVTLAVWNCCPLLPTDGYFIVATLLRQANWRIRSWRELSLCLRQRRKPRVLLLAYAAGSSIGLALLAVHSVDRILRMMNFSWFGYAVVLLLMLIFGLKRAALRRQGREASIGGM